jgi:meso-butanediol dehydrogenase / (S,S)-butanediol dehydrogenase / diacetyl reductase
MSPALEEITGNRLAAKRVLVTGTGRGQGATAQELFCRHGATVFGCDVLDGSAEAEAARLRAAGLSAGGATVDLTDPAAAAAWVEAGVREMGGVDVLYNNASKPIFAFFGEMTFEQWRETMAHELDLIFTVTRAAWPHLADGGGSIVNTGSISAHVGMGRAGGAAHAAAKGGVIALTKQLAAEGAPLGIRANTISPGFIATPGTDAVHPSYRDWLVDEAQLVHRAGTPLDVAQLALYLASDESDLVTGADFTIDAGTVAART